MDALSIALVVLVIAASCAVVVLAVVLFRIYKLLSSTNVMLNGVNEQIQPMLNNANQMTTDMVPVVKKVEPLVDRVQLTLDAVNLEMMRVDEILEDVSQITDSASSATSAVENITNAPVKAVNNVATRMRAAFGGKSASDEAARLAAQRAAVAQALADYEAVHKADKDDGKQGAPEPDAAVPDPEAAAPADAAPNFDGFEKIVADTTPEDQAVIEAAEAAIAAAASTQGPNATA